MSTYLPAWATLAEAELWLSEATGEAWPLPRLIEAGVYPRVWLEYPGPGPAESAFEGRKEGFLAEFAFASELQRLAIDRSAVLTWTRTPSGAHGIFDPPVQCDLANLRFSRDDLRALASAPPTPTGPTIKRDELIRRHIGQWPTIRDDLREAGRRHPGLKKAMAGGGRWHEAVALAWARENNRIRTPGDGAALQAIVTGRKHRIKK